MIKDQKPITMAEVVEIIGESDKGKEVKKFIKEFVKMKAEEAINLKEKIKALNIYKLNEENIVSIVNFMPENAQELIKILPDVNLEQEEINKILEALK